MYYPNIFYYYQYQDIYALLDAWFREKVDPFVPQDHSFEWKSATKSLLYQCKAHPKTIYHVFDCLSHDHLERYIFSLTDDTFTKMVKQAAEGHTLSDDRPRSIAPICRYAYIGLVMQFFWNRMENDIDESVDRLVGVFDTFLASAVQAPENQG